jgi:hypothetical protein
MISLGVYPHLNLATAHLLHADARGLLARDIDPSADWNCFRHKRN